MRRLKIKHIWVAGCSFTSLVCAGPVLAQEAPAPQSGAQPANKDPGDIIVTARRIGESLQKVPVAITAFSAANIRDNGIKSPLDLQGLTPSLEIVNNQSNAAGLQISMRGQIQADTAVNAPGSVGVYIDDVFDGGAQLSGKIIPLHDLQRVEVLKGPQGTLYGRNVTAGLVKFVTNKPTNAFEAYVTGGLGNYDRHFLEGMVNVPIVDDKLAVRVLGYLDTHSGYSRDTVNNRDLENQHDYGFRAQLKYDPTPELSILLQGFYAKGHDNGPDDRTTYVQPGLNLVAFNIIAEKQINGLTAAALSPLVFGGSPAQVGAAYVAATAALPQVQSLVQQYLNAPRSNTFEDSRFEGYDHNRTESASLTIAYDIGGATLKSITAFAYDISDALFIGAGGDFGLGAQADEYESDKQYTEEVQLTGGAFSNRLKYSSGIFLIKSQEITNRAPIGIHGFFPFILGDYGLGVTGASNAYNVYQDKSAALYGQASYALINNLNLTLGARYTTEDVSLFSNTVAEPNPAIGAPATCLGPAPNTTATPVAQCGVHSPEYSNSNFSYTAGLDYTLVQDALVYAKVSRGFKSGGLNGYESSPSPLSSYSPEVITDYEMGLKSQFLDHRVILDLSAYHTKGNGLQKQVTVNFGTAINPILGTATQNAARATINGVELEAQVRPVGGVMLGATAAYTKPKYDTYTQVNLAFPGGIQDLSSQPFAYTPRFTYSLSAAYKYETAWGSLRPQVNWEHRSGTYLYAGDLAPTTPGSTNVAPADLNYQGAYGLLSATFGIEIAKYNATLDIFARNILNKRYKISAVSNITTGLPAGEASFGPPATVGADLTVRFK